MPNAVARLLILIFFIDILSVTIPVGIGLLVLNGQSRATQDQQQQTAIAAAFLREVNYICSITAARAELSHLPPPPPQICDVPVP